MDALAGKAGAAGAVKRCSEFLRLVVNPSVQVGEHQAGAGCWRAASGSGSIRGGAGGSEPGDVCAQLLSSSAKLSSAARVKCGIFLDT